MFRSLSNYLSNILWEIDLPKPMSDMNIHLDLGCGNNPRNPFKAIQMIGCDVIDSNQINIACPYVQCDVSEKLPFETNSFSSVSAYDVIEHIPRLVRENEKVVYPFVNLMSEIYRVLKPGGIFYAITPMFPSSAAFGDPTHVNFITKETVNYFADSCHAKTLGYGFDGNFKLIFADWLRGAGPFDTSESLFGKISANPSSMESILASCKLLNRYIRRISNHRPTHSLWVLQKPKLDH